MKAIVNRLGRSYHDHVIVLMAVSIF